MPHARLCYWSIPAWSSWQAHIDSYIKWPGYEPMAEFVRQLAASPYAGGLHAGQSVGTLIVAQLPIVEPKHEALEVQFNPRKQRFYFDFWEQPFTEKHWARKCGPAEAFILFERFLKAKRWFVDEKQET